LHRRPGGPRPSRYWGSGSRGGAEAGHQLPEALKRTLLAAKSIVYTDPAIGGASGIHFEKVLDRLGIAKEIKAQSIKNPLAATKPNAEFVARGEAELGVQLISEIVSVPAPSCSVPCRATCRP